MIFFMFAVLNVKYLAFNTLNASILMLANTMINLTNIFSFFDIKI